MLSPDAELEAGGAQAGVTTSRRASEPLIYAVTTSGVMVNALIAPIAPDIARAFGHPETHAAALLVVASLPGVVAAPVVGALADRHGRRRVLAACLTIYGLSGVGGMFAGGFTVLLATRTLQGVGSAGLVNLAVVLISDTRGGHERARVLGRNSAVLAVVPAIVPLAAGGITARWGWRPVFSLYAIALVTAIAVIAHLDDQRSNTPQSPLRATAAGALRDRGLTVPLGIGVSLFAIVSAVTLTVLPIVLDQQGFGPLERGLILMVPASCSAASALGAARAIKRVGALRVTRLGMTTLAIGALVIALQGPVAVTVLGAVVAGAGEGLVVPAVLHCLADATMPARRGAITALWVSGARIGQVVGATAAGVALSTVGAGATAAAAAAVGAGTVAWSHERRGSEGSLEEL